jgi:hypothetical protein
VISTCEFAPCAPGLQSPKSNVGKETLSDCPERETLAPNRPAPHAFNHPVAPKEYIGVCWTVEGWYARYEFADGRFQGLGFWRTQIDAAREYDFFARQVEGPFAQQNFPLFVGGRMKLACWALLLLMPHALTVAQIAVRA